MLKFSPQKSIFSILGAHFNYTAKMHGILIGYICWYSWIGFFWGQLLDITGIFFLQSNSPPGIKAYSNISTSCIHPSCAKNSLELPLSKNEHLGTEGMGSKQYHWLSKISASASHKSILNKDFQHRWNWISHFGLEEQFTWENVLTCMVV